jgi:hypothetical protein
MNTYKAHSKNDELEKFPLYVIARQKYPMNMPKEAKNVVLYYQNHINKMLARDGTLTVRKKIRLKYLLPP